MSKRSGQQNRMYHALCTRLRNTKEIKIYDGRFELAGHPNPIRFRPSGFSYDSMRGIFKQCDLEYPKDERGVALSSAKTTVEQMVSHSTFLEILLLEGSQLQETDWKEVARQAAEYFCSNK